jgi:hypothetical protein
MNSRNKNNEQKSQETDQHFNTDDRLKPSKKKVGPGYDDTGKGNDAHASHLDEKRSSQRQNDAGNKK